MAERKVKYRLKGHESFTLREGWLTKGLLAVHGNPEVFSDNYGADELGVGTNMAKSIRYWLRCAQLTSEEGKRQVSLTELGETLLREDPYFEEDFSLWLVHLNIAGNFEQATSWYLFFNEYEQENITKRRMQQELQELICEKAGTAEISERSLQDDCDAILHMYNGKKQGHVNPEEKKISPFARLGLLREADGIYRREQPDLKKLDPLIVLYAMQDILEEGEGYLGVSVEKLLRAPKSPGRLLQLRRSFLMQYLEDLEKEECLTLNRTAGLDMVYQRHRFTQKEILRKYFERK